MYYIHTAYHFGLLTDKNTESMEIEYFFFVEPNFVIISRRTGIADKSILSICIRVYTYWVQGSTNYLIFVSNHTYYLTFTSLSINVDARHYVTLMSDTT